MTPAIRRSPLAHRSEIACKGLTLVERPFEAKLILRGGDDVMKRAAEPLELEVPAACRFVEGGGALMGWLSPDEALIVGPEGAEGTLTGQLADALGEAHHLISNVTDYYTTLSYAGPRAREGLMKLTTLDMHPRGFVHGDLKGSVFMHANAWIAQRTVDDSSEGPAFDLIVRWTFADYLWCALSHSGREWGLPEQTPLGGERLVV